MKLQKSISAQSAEASDGILVGQILAGDARAFETLVRRYSALLFAYTYRYMRDDDQACDVLQHVWLHLYLSLPTLRTENPLKPWLLRVARNRCLDELRKRRRRCVMSFSELEGEAEDEELLPLASIPDFHPLPEEIAEHHDLQHTLRRAIQALPPKFRTVVLLRYADQLSFFEIGQVLKIPTATVKTYYYRACPLLKAQLTAQRQT
ncbi:MAG: RNA polymerase sigma factor, partial [Chloroflexota bacterium]|nr:RNA polymerase sigma factor [Chloroflexota bacterium]